MLSEIKKGGCALLTEKQFIVNKMLELIEILENEKQYLKDSKLTSVANVKEEEIHKLKKCIEILSE